MQKVMIAFCVAGLVIIFGALHASANEPKTAVLSPLEDTFVNAFDPNQNFDKQNLIVESGDYYTPQMGGSCPGNPQQILLKFDLGQVDFEISKVRVSLISTVANAPLAEMFPNFGLSDEWSEETVTWESRPRWVPFHSRAVRLAQTNRVFWESQADGSSTLSDYLAAEQAINGGDNIATIVIADYDPPGCQSDVEEGAISAEFFDRTHPTYAPLLEVADASSQLPQHPDPTAVQLSSIGTFGTTNWVDDILLAFFVGITAFVLTVFIKKPTQKSEN